MQNSSNSFIQSLNEKDSELFKKWLKGHLAIGKVTVVFTKKDGSERTMVCTTSADLVPVEPVNESITPKREKKINEEVCPVYDTDAKGWRSFRWDSVKEIKIEI